MFNRVTSRICRFVAITGLSCICLNTFAKDYYISSSKGKDSNRGSERSPWKTLDKISSVGLEPGDKVLFKKGDRFDGHFVVNGSGTKSKFIVISSYGSGKKPIITGEVGELGGGDYQEAILVENNDHIAFCDIEVQNERIVNREGVKEDDAYGLNIVNSGASVMRNFLIKNVTFKNVYAPKPVLRDEGESAFNNLEVAALRFFSTRNMVDGEEKHIRNAIVQGCYFENLQRLGVHIKHAGARGNIGDEQINSNMNFVFRNNEFHNTGGTCILPIRTYNCLIEKNLFDHPGHNSDPRMPARGSSVWTWHCYNTVIQYNRCLHIRGYMDSHGVHIDHNNHDTFVQYNYMEDCEGGFVEILGGNVNSVYRFNVSVNDGWRDNPQWKTSNHTLWINEKVWNGEKQPEQNYIYNNTIYMDRAYDTSIDLDGKGIYIFNNIFCVNKGTVGQKQMVVKDHGTDFVVSNNLYHGFVSSRFTNFDKNAVTGDPRFARVKVGSDKGFNVKKSSVAAGVGMAMKVPPIPGAGNGIFKHVPAYPTVDYYGKPLNAKQPTIGACNPK